MSARSLPLLRDIRQIVSFAIGAGVVVPLFVVIGGAPLVILGRSYDQYGQPGYPVPVSLLIAVVATCGLLLQTIAKGRVRIPGPTWVWLYGLFLFLSSVSFVAGVFSHGTLAGWPFLLQFSLPVAGAFISLATIRSIEDVVCHVRGMVFMIGAYSLAVLVSNASRILGPFHQFMFEDKLFGIGIYQFRDYVPSVQASMVAISIGELLHTWRRRGRLEPIRILLFLSILAVLPFLGSVGSMIIALAACCCWLFHTRHYFAGLALSSALLLFTAQITGLLTPFLPEVQHLGTFSARLSKWSAELRIICQSPLLGLQFVPSLVTPGGLRVAKPHNQWIDIAVKAGLPALLVFLLAEGLLMRDLICLTQKTSGEISLLCWGFIYALIGQLVVNSAILVPLEQPITGIFVGYLTGILRRISALTYNR